MNEVNEALFRVSLSDSVPELKSRPKSSRPRREIDATRLDRNFEQNVETRSRLERAETETKHETFEPNFSKCHEFFNINFR